MEKLKQTFFSLKYKSLWMHSIKNVTEFWKKKSCCDLTSYCPRVCVEGQRRSHEKLLKVVAFLFKELGRVFPENSLQSSNY